MVWNQDPNGDGRDASDVFIKVDGKIIRRGTGGVDHRSVRHTCNGNGEFIHDRIDATLAAIPIKSVGALEIQIRRITQIRTGSVGVVGKTPVGWLGKIPQLEVLRTIIGRQSDQYR